VRVKPSQNRRSLIASFHVDIAALKRTIMFESDTFTIHRIIVIERKIYFCEKYMDFLQVLLYTVERLIDVV